MPQIIRQSQKMKLERCPNPLANFQNEALGAPGGLWGTISFHESYLGAAPEFSESTCSLKGTGGAPRAAWLVLVGVCGSRRTPSGGKGPPQIIDQRYVHRIKMRARRCDIESNTPNSQWRCQNLSEVVEHVRAGQE